MAKLKELLKTEAIMLLLTITIDQYVDMFSLFFKNTLM